MIRITSSLSGPERARSHPKGHQHTAGMIGTTMAVTSVPLVGRSDTRVGAASDQRSYRLASLDLLRGLVIVIMAIDHVRDFFLAGALQDPTTDPNVTLGLFMTRWITHFCAPVFVLLAGVSAGLMSARRTPTDLARLLFTRGLWLIAIEWFVVSTSATFAPAGIPQVGGQILVTMQVIWAIGASMVVLSAAQWLDRRACLLIGALVIAGHNLLDPIWPTTGVFDQNWPLWTALHSQMSISVGPFLLAFLYPLLPWTGVMLFGFGVSMLFERPDAARNASLVKWGLALTAVFLVLRALDLYGDPNHWESQARGLIATVIDVLNTTKYPPSLDFVLMTLGAGRASLCVRRQGPVRHQRNTHDVRARAVRLLHRARRPDSHVERAVGRHAGFSRESAHDVISVLSAGLRRLTARRLPRVGGGDRDPVSVVSLDGECKGSPSGLVAQLRVNTAH